tara:strand:+ start:2915 stop:3637 length:723 start_codon:yes stop_codon:yes gene_type:complete
VTDKKVLWDKLSKTDPAHTKSFSRSGGFKGTAIKPQWVVMRLTEEFGPCGLGWGINRPEFQVVPAGSEVMVYCTVSCWHGTLDNVLWGVGGDKVSTSRQSGTFNDDEAFKKAFTDAIMNAFKFLGVAADVHMGLFDDSKYVQEVKADFAERLKGNGGVQPEGEDWYGCNGEAGMSAAKAKAEGLGETFDGWLSAVDIIPTMEVWKTWCRDHDDVIKTLPRGWRVQIREAVDARKKELGAA